MPTIGSIAMTNAMMLSGRFSVPKTIRLAKVAPPPEPATPKEATVTTATSVITNCRERMFVPERVAEMAPRIAGYTPAQPFWPKYKIYVQYLTIKENLNKSLLYFLCLFFLSFFTLFASDLLPK